MNIPGTLNEISLSMIMHKRGKNDRLGPDSVQKYNYRNIQLANVFVFIGNTLVKEKVRVKQGLK